MKLNQYNIDYSKILTKKFLTKEYIVNKKSTYQIAKAIGCVPHSILNYLKIHNIPRRTHSEANIGINKGNKNGNYTDGRTNKVYYCKDCLKNGIKTKIGGYTAIDGQGRCHSCAAKFMWSNKKFRDSNVKAVLKGLNLSPNKPEILLIKLLANLLSKEYKFVGDGKLIVGGFCPDFVNKDNNKIIEFYGDYWHNRGDWSKRDIGRLKEYKKAGYKTLIIWEHELKDLNKLKNKILEFNK